MAAGNLGRVKLSLHANATARQYRELGGFVRHCIERIERDLAPAHSWRVKIVPDRVYYGCEVVVRYGDDVVEANGVGFDGAVAGREAFTKIEDLLRANRQHHELDATCEVAHGGR
jgi:hypothetical protein